MNLGKSIGIFMLFVVVFGVVPGVATAYVRKTNLSEMALHWQDGRAEIWLDSKGAPGVGFARTEAALKQAIEIWNEVCCSMFKFVYRGSVENASIEFNLLSVESNSNVVVWSTVDQSYFNGHAGATFVRVLDSGRIIDADVELNAFKYTWTDGTPKSDEMSIQNALVYYLGLAFGLDRSYANGSVLKDRPLAGDSSKLTLGQDDQFGICAIYTAAFDSQCTIGQSGLNDADTTPALPDLAQFVDSGNQPQYKIGGGSAACELQQGSPQNFLDYLSWLILLMVPMMMRMRMRREKAGGRIN